MEGFPATLDAADVSSFRAANTRPVVNTVKPRMVGCPNWPLIIGRKLELKSKSGRRFPNCTDFTQSHPIRATSAQRHTT